MAVAVGVDGGNEDSNEGSSVELAGGVEGGGAGTVAEEEAEAKGEGRLLSMSMSSTVHLLFFQTAVWCTIINLAHHRTRQEKKYIHRL